MFEIACSDEGSDDRVVETDEIVRITADEIAGLVAVRPVTSRRLVAAIRRRLRVSCMTLPRNGPPGLFLPHPVNGPMIFYDPALPEHKLVRVLIHEVAEMLLGRSNDPVRHDQQAFEFTPQPFVSGEYARHVCARAVEEDVAKRWGVFVDRPPAKRPLPFDRQYGAARVETTRIAVGDPLSFPEDDF